MLGKSRILSFELFYQMRSINSIKREHSCKVLYFCLYDMLGKHVQVFRHLPGFVLCTKQ